MSQEDFMKHMIETGKFDLKGKEAEIAVKQAKISDLLMDDNVIIALPPFDQFFDENSDKLLDEKIEVLEALKAGKTISEIPNFYDVLELYPKNGETWD